jgi:amino acid transporter
MKEPKIKEKSESKGFGLINIIGLIFLLIGIISILLFLEIMPFDLSILKNPLQYGTAAGSLIAGILLLFRKS